ncbi:hypothetical protein GCM10023084_73130 [Streptomyces lacrimifluminis]|uniref:Uncharacterized protein n=1 Tax=Streptomyces lacrimifluminis TaxID=1500077 RepID=A0A917P6A7_9ACTN|nr:hypothetical protein [Streptomyces lacrimifluminis]GGJ63748.1 hypothetical protein GCM10012282_71210 [Streptomyces lacrimifluminis]
MSSAHTLTAPSPSAQVFAPWRNRTPGQALPWRSLASLGLDPEPGAENTPGAQNVVSHAPSGCRAGGGESPGSPNVVESAPVPRHPVRDHRPMPQEA